MIQNDADTVGEAMKKLSELLFQNQAELIADKYGIPLKDENGNFRNTFEILTDLGKAVELEIESENETTQN